MKGSAATTTEICHAALGSAPGTVVLIRQEVTAGLVPIGGNIAIALAMPNQDTSWIVGHSETIVSLPLGVRSAIRLCDVAQCRAGFPRAAPSRNPLSSLPAPSFAGAKRRKDATEHDEETHLC